MRIPGCPFEVSIADATAAHAESTRFQPQPKPRAQPASGGVAPASPTGSAQMGGGGCHPAVARHLQADQK